MIYIYLQKLDNDDEMYQAKYTKLYHNIVIHYYYLKKKKFNRNVKC